MPRSILRPAPSTRAAAPQLVDGGGGALANGSYFLLSSIDASFLLLPAYTVIESLRGAWLQGLAQYGVQTFTYKGFGSTPLANGIFPIILCTEAEAHAYDAPNFVYNVDWAAFHDVDARGNPYAVCPQPDNPAGGFSQHSIFTQALTHELAELLTDPVPGTGWHFPDGSEADDTVCQWRPIQINGEDISPYWDNAQGRCFHSC